MFFDDDKNDELLERNFISTEDNAMFSNPNRTSEPEYLDSSIFGEGSCGEPLIPQHIVLDFTPNEEIDNDFAQEKCCMFWDFIRSQPDFHEWLMLPEPDDNVTKSSDAESIRIDVSGGIQIEPGEALKSPTALSMLEFIQRKGLIDRIFETKMPQSHCSLDPGENQEDKESIAKSLDIKRDKSSAACPCEGVCESCNKQLPRKPPSSTAVRALCEKMDEWDDKHPKSMEPPRQPPALTPCIMQRKHMI